MIMEAIKYSSASIIAVIVIYILIRVFGVAIFRSYFQVKKQFKQEKTNGSKEQE